MMKNDGPIAMIRMELDQLKFSFYLKGDNTGRYTQEQKDHAIAMIDKYGVRATARILDMDKRTIQRWCREFDIKVNRCPAWVYDRAKRRKLRDRPKIKRLTMSPLKKDLTASLPDYKSDSFDDHQAKEASKEWDHQANELTKGWDKEADELTKGWDQESDKQPESSKEVYSWTKPITPDVEDDPEPETKSVWQMSRSEFESYQRNKRKGI
jgi:hypothetical protein